jgi:uncharacterized protein
MPINYEYIDGQILITTDHGDFKWVSQKEFDTLLTGNLQASSAVFHDLQSKQIITHNVALAVDLAAAKIRSRKRYLYDFTSLHMLVTTVRCNQRCEYCQVSCEDDEAFKYDMSVETAKSIVDTIFKSPSQSIKIEFQGGEPTLNWPVITYVVEYATELNDIHKKHLDFVVCTNLTAITEDKLKYFADNNVYVSTSLDGPKQIHDFGRKNRNGTSAYETFVQNLELARCIVGEDHVDALMTTTLLSLKNCREIIDEYLRLGFNGLFLRDLNPYGFAAEQRDILGYDSIQFVQFYKECLDYILELNKQGTRVSEYYTALLFKRMMTSQSTGFVDLQSPSGAVISGVIYDYNGDVYPADEARMLARMGDRHFYMGNTTRDTFKHIFGSDIAREITAQSCLEIIPGCSDCVYHPYCGADPIRNYLEYGDLIGKQSQSNFCLKNKGIFEHLFEIVRQDDPKTLDILWSWISPGMDGGCHEVV